MRPTVRSACRLSVSAGHQQATAEVATVKFIETTSAMLVVSAMFFALSACQKQEGPAERAGKETDKAVEKVGQQIEKAGENIQDAAKGNKK